MSAMSETSPMSPTRSRSSGWRRSSTGSTPARPACARPSTSAARAASWSTYCAAELDAVGEGLKELNLDELAAKLDSSVEPERSTRRRRPASVRAADPSRAGPGPGSRGRGPSRALDRGDRELAAADPGDGGGEVLAAGLHLRRAEHGERRAPRGARGRRRRPRPRGRRGTRPPRGRRSCAGSRSGRRARRAPSRRGGRSCSRRPAAARRRARPAGRSSRAGRCRRRRAGSAPRPGPASRRRRSARAEAEPSQSRTGASSAVASVRVRVEPGRHRVAPRQLRRRLAPPVRLAPLEQRVHGGPLRRPLLTRRGRRPALLRDRVWTL